MKFGTDTHKGTRETPTTADTEEMESKGLPADAQDIQLSELGEKEATANRWIQEQAERRLLNMRIVELDPLSLNTGE